MPEICPNCQTELVPSVVGYLCSECGEVHKFYKTDPSEESAGLGNQKIRKYQPTEESIPATPRSKTKISQPELPSALDPDHELTSPPPIHDDIELIPDHSEQHLSDHEQVSLADARQYRKKLRHRLKSLVVPELPQHHDDKKTEKKVAAPDPIEVLPPLPPKPADRLPDDSATSSTAPQKEKAAQNAPETVSSRVLSQDDYKTPTGNKKTLYALLGLSIGAAIAIGATYLITKRSNVSLSPSASPSPSVVASATPTASPSVSPSTDPEASKRDSQRKKDLKDIATALEVYRKATGSYPAGSDINAVYPLQYTNPPYISYINYDPSSSDNNKIKYGYTSDGTSFTLSAKLEVSTDSEAKDGIYTVTNTKN